MELIKKKPLPPERAQECAALKAIFNEKKAELGLTQEKAAHHLGMNQGSFSHYLNGRNALNLEFALSVAKLLGVAVSDFAPRYGAKVDELSAESKAHYDKFSPDKEGAGGVYEKMGVPRALGYLYPIVGWEHKRARNPHAESFDDEDDYHQAGSTEFAGVDGFWLIATGLAMVSDTAPSFPPGIFLLICPDDYPLVNGRFYLAKNADGDLIVRRYFREAGIEYLSPLNSAYPVVERFPDWHFVGMVVDARMPGV